MTLQDLARSVRADPALLDAAGVRRVSDADARLLGFTHRGRLDGLHFPYIDPSTGQTHPGRVRRDHPDLDEAGKQKAKYVACYGERPRLYFAPDAAAHLADVAIAVVITEAEKSALAVTASAARVGRSVLAIATGGVFGGRGRIGKATSPDGARVDERGWSPDWQHLTWPMRDAIIVFDAGVPSNPQLVAGRHALAAHLRSLGARVRLVDLPVEPGVNGPDDYLGRHDDGAFWQLVDAARMVQPDDPADVLRACGLSTDTLTVSPSPADLERRLRQLAVMVKGADGLRARVLREGAISALKAVKVAGAAGLVDAALVPVATTTASSLVQDDQPAEHPVDGAQLLDDLAGMARRYVVFPRDEMADAVALWVMHAWSIAATSLSPILGITSPAKRCGKSTLLMLVSALTPRSLPSSSLTPAVLYRVVDAHAPTLLIDEADTLLRDNPDLRALINAGFLKATANVPRCVGDDHEPVLLSSWCPKVIALIGRLPDTTHDRTIHIELRRRGPGEHVDRLRHDRLRELGDDYRRRAARWSADHLDAIRRQDPDLPDRLHDRARDCWRPLVAIADLAGGTWPTRARAAALALAGGDEPDELPIALQLLADVRDVFEDAGEDHLASSEVVKRLVGLPDRPWGAYGKLEKPITQTRVAGMLRPFKVRPVKTWVSSKTVNAYHRRDLAEPCTRYLPGSQTGRAEGTNESEAKSHDPTGRLEQSPSSCESPKTSMNTGILPVFQSEDPGVDDEVPYGEF